jgi:two-component system, NtrC family, response regulator AtoC
MVTKLIGHSPSIKNIRKLINVVANTALSVIIYGETGVGKEVVARELHKRSNRRNKEFIKVNCTALPFELLESELFGYEQGAFTGATRFKPGKFEIASDGVLFLDEIGDLPLNMQAKLLQVLQSGEFTRLGGRSIKVNTWIVAATNHNLEHDLQEGRFREDLYYRLNMIKINIPPLRERKEDIHPLIKYFMEKYRPELEIDEDYMIDPDMIDFFLQYDWPGNVRELANTVQRLMVMEDWDEIKSRFSGGSEILARESGLNSILPAPHSHKNEVIPLKELKAKAGEYIERKVITYVLHRTGGNKVKAAKIMNISYKTLFNKMNDLGLKN